VNESERAMQSAIDQLGQRASDAHGRRIKETRPLEKAVLDAEYEALRLMIAGVFFAWEVLNKMPCEAEARS